MDPISILGFSPIELGVIFIVITIGATLQGAVGYGMALVVSPVLLLIDPRFIPAPLTVAAFLLVLLVAIRDRQALDFFGLKWALLGMAAGMLLGTWTLANYSGASFAAIFAILILSAVLVSALGLRFSPKPPVMAGAGFFSGLMGILTTTSGPPMALVYQDAPGAKLRATISGFFIVGTIFALISLSTIGRFGMEEIQLGLLLMPGIVLGYFLSSRATAYVDRGFVRPLVLTIAAVSAGVILVTQVF